ncbi:MAG: energy transducer TonB [Proteobacteria bacterium]|nr:energy transducer TonB [Pseudomonadota bacterium]
MSDNRITAMKNLILCVLLPFSLSLSLATSAQNKKPSWSEAMPEKKEILNRNIDFVDEFTLDKKKLTLDRESIFNDESDSVDYSAGDSIDDSEELSNKIEQAKIATDRKRVEQNLLAKKTELERIAVEQAAQERIAATNIEQELIDAANAEQERIALEKTVSQQIPNNNTTATSDSELPVYNWIKLKSVLPKYPAQAARKNIEGWVEVELEINPNGDVIAAKVIKTFKDNKIFNKATLEAVQQWKFKPPSNLGITYNQTQVARLNFQL